MKSNAHVVLLRLGILYQRWTRNRKRRTDGNEAYRKMERGSTESRTPWRTVKIYIGIYSPRSDSEFKRACNWQYRKKRGRKEEGKYQDGEREREERGREIRNGKRTKWEVRWRKFEGGRVVSIIFYPKTAPSLRRAILLICKGASEKWGGEK